MALMRDETPLPKAAARKRRPRRLLLAFSVVGAVGLIAIVALLVRGISADSPVPADVRSAVTFPIYYPKQSKLPAGYSLDASSIRLAQAGVVIYSVQTGNQKLVFSEEETPGSNVIDKFTSSYIPLHNTVMTNLGKAQIGATGQGANLQTVVSFPITKGPWVVVTAPANTKQSDLQQVLQSLTK